MNSLQHILSVMGEGELFDAYQLVKLTGLRHATVSSALSKLWTHRQVKRVAPGVYVRILNAAPIPAGIHCRAEKDKARLAALNRERQAEKDAEFAAGGIVPYAISRIPVLHNIWGQANACHA